MKERRRTTDDIARCLGLQRAGPDYPGPTVDGWRFTDLALRALAVDARHPDEVKLRLRHMVARLGVLVAERGKV